MEKDSNHEKAVLLMEEIIKGKYGSAITSEYIFDETVTVILVRSKSLESAAMSGEMIKKSMLILEVSSSVFEDSWDRFQRIDKYDVDRILEVGSSQLESNSLSAETSNYLCD